MTITKKILIIPPLLSLLFLTACGQPKVAAPQPEKPALQVKGQTVAQSRSSQQVYEYPALVLSQQEARVMAKTSGTVKQQNYKLGDTVKIGQILARIDDVNQGGALGSGLAASQVRQAQLTVEQAEINKRNLALTSAESLKSAQIAHESAKIANEQARLNLANREKSIAQSFGDVDTNAKTAADAAADTCGAIITGINNITNFDPTTMADSPYKNNLGVADNQLAIDAKAVYGATKFLYDSYRDANLADIDDKVGQTIKLVDQTSRLADITKKYLDASLVGGPLSQTVLSGFQTTVAGYQAQASAALREANGAKQTLENNIINSNTSSDALNKAYDLAKQQEKNAQQALATQQANIKSALDAAELQYRNALLGLQSIIDIHLVIAPLSGKVTQNFTAMGETVSAGQLMATISSGQTVKFQFYIDETVLKKISPGQLVAIKNNENKEVRGKITSLSTQADAFSKRFLVEVAPVNFNAADFSLGTVINILITVEKKSDSGNIILPLSAIEIGQNGNGIFIIGDGRAKQIPVTIIKIQGETAEIKTDLPETAIIITDGNKLVQEDDLVVLRE